MKKQEFLKDELIENQHQVTYPKMDFGVTIVATVGGALVECIIESKAENGINDTKHIKAQQSDFIKLTSDVERSKNSLAGLNKLPLAS